VAEVDELCSLAVARIRKWARIVREAMDRTADLDQIAALLDERTASEFDEATGDGDRDRYEVLSSMRMNAAGLVRYWRKREERDAAGPRIHEAGSHS
jgi:hypothetical protein